MGPPMTLSNGGVLCLLPVLPRLVPAGHGVAAPEPAKKATDPSGNLPVITWRPRPPAKNQPSRLRKKGKALSRSVWSLNCLGGIRHVIGQFE